MASVLVPLSDVLDYLGDADDQEIPVIERLVDSIEALFRAQANRRERPYQAAQAARVETHDGTGTGVLVLEYPIQTLTSVVIGPDPIAPVETLVVADVNVLRFAPGRALLTRIGGTFGRCGDPRVVRVTYDAAADLPPEVQLAVLSVAAAVHRRRGSEDAAKESVGGYSTDLATIAKSDGLWQLAIASQWVPVFG